MRAIARAMAVLCAWIAGVLSRLPGTFEKLSVSEAATEVHAAAVGAGCTTGCRALLAARWHAQSTGFTGMLQSVRCGSTLRSCAACQTVRASNEYASSTAKSPQRSPPHRPEVLGRSEGSLRAAIRPLAPPGAHAPGSATGSATAPDPAGRGDASAVGRQPQVREDPLDHHRVECLAGMATGGMAFVPGGAVKGSRPAMRWRRPRPPVPGRRLPASPLAR